MFRQGDPSLTFLCFLPPAHPNDPLSPTTLAVQALGAAVTLRCAHAFAAHLNQVWLLIYCAGASAAILRERAAPPSYARWRERLAAGTGLLCFGLGLACTHPRLILDSYTGAAVLDFAHHALLLLFSSGAVAICALACSWRVRFRCSALSAGCSGGSARRQHSRSSSTLHAAFYRQRPIAVYHHQRPTALHPPPASPPTHPPTLQPTCPPAASGWPCGWQWLPPTRPTPATSVRQRPCAIPPPSLPPATCTVLAAWCSDAVCPCSWPLSCSLMPWASAPPFW